MSPALRTALRGLFIVAGIAVTIAGAFAMRAEDWPIYVVFVLLSFVLFSPSVEVLPNLALPMPGNALCIGFLYIGGLPIVFLRNIAPPFLTQLLRWALPGRELDLAPDFRFWRRGPSSTPILRGEERDAVAADWSAFGLGLATRWWVASWLAPGGRPAGSPLAILAGEVVGYAFWALVAVLPIFSFRPVLIRTATASLHTVHHDLGIIMVLALTPFVFLIAYGYEAHGLAGAAAWSLSALGLHFILQRLNERRVTVEEQNRRLETLNRELEHRERLSAIGKMSSVVSHQMLQQLGLIGIHADLIRNSDGTEDPVAAVGQAKRHAGAIEDALQGVNRVLTDLLIFSRDLRLNLYEQRLCDVLTECLEECRTVADERRVSLRLDCPVDVTAVVDKLKIKQAIVNVLRNAIEVSPEGTEVGVQVAARDGWAEIAVSDAGPGVPERDRDAIFTPFFTTKEQGTGLGLAIAREFTEAHHGRITVEPRNGGGSTFVIRLPLRQPAESRPSDGGR